MKQVATITEATAHIIIEHRLFNHICQVAPICSHLIHGSLDPPINWLSRLHRAHLC